jgi:cyclopropane-fatty-acyl-phospholipid synthase
MSTKLKTHIENLLKNSDIVINGTRPWDLQVHDERLYSRVLTHGTLGLGEAYMDGWWDAEQVDVFIHKLLLANIKAHFPVDISLYGSALKGVLLNLQRSHITEVGERHYDIGNDLYEAMLDSRMIYSCGYWKEAETLDAAQEAKLDLICRKAGLEKGMRILDIGSGWGGFLKFAAERYGVSGVGITISKEQAAYANAHRDGLPIETRLMDYQALDDKFDRIISIGMFEHVGYKNYRAYMEKARSLLKPDGLFVLHTIGGNHTTTHGDPWSEKYIFPNGMLPSAKQMTTASEGVFVTEDWHNFGADYDRTLMAWHQRFEAAWPAFQHKYDERFYRMWRYYLLSFAATFRARKIQLWQVVYSPEGVPGGYRSPR